MDEQRAWIKGRVLTGWALVATGGAILAISLILRAANAFPGVNMGVIGGLGILALGFGIGLVAQYRRALHDEAAARRVIVAERDERTVGIKTRAGNRAWVVSAVITWLGLMWASLAANGNLPRLDGDVLWWFLVAALGIPFFVYAGSITYEERTS
ncbi:MAG: hypothetical protein U0838_12020 [Chloroflexota bacterium]